MADATTVLTKVRDAEGEASALAGVPSLQEQVATLSAQVATLTSQVAALQAKIDAAKLALA